MPLPYTLDLNPLVSYDPQKGFQQNQPEDVRWLNNKEAHEGNFYFMAGYYQHIQECYMIQALKVSADRVAKTDLPSKLENAFQDENADSKARFDLFDDLFSLAGAQHNDFEKDGILVPAQINICFHKNDKIGFVPHIEVWRKENHNSYVSKDFPSEAKFDMKGNLIEAQILYPAHNGENSLKKLAFNDKGCLKSLIHTHPQHDGRILEGVNFNDNGRMIAMKTGIVETVDDYWDQKLPRRILTEASEIQTEAKALRNSYKVKFDYNF